jgi:hypothetical protein
MSHDCHERLPGFDPQQILVDGCRECEARSKWNDHGISSLDAERFATAWHRAREWQTQGLSTISDAEIPLLDTLWSLHVVSQRAAARFVSRSAWGVEAVD